MRRRDELLSKSIGKSSWKAYATAWTSYTTFLKQIQVFAPLPLTETLLELYIASVSNGLAYTTIKSYLSGIKFMHVLAGYPLQGLFSHRLHLILKGTRRGQGSSRTRPRRLPISMPDLSLLVSTVQRVLSRHDATMFRAAFTLAFFGLLRVSEFTCPAGDIFDGRCHLGLRDVFVDPGGSMVRIRIKVSKSDPFREGAIIRLSRTDSQLCPVNAMLHYLQFRSLRPDGPLFIFQSGIFLTRQHIVRVLGNTFPLIPQGSLGSHSLHICGASKIERSK